MRLCTFKKFLAVGGLCAMAVLMSGTVRAQALVVDGEQIADAKIFAAAKKEGKVLVYGTWPERNWNPAIKANFEKDTGLTLEFVRMTTQVLYQRVTAEAAANRLAADIIDVTDASLLADLIKRNILNRPYRVPNFARIHPEAKDLEGRWYAFFRLPTAVGINTKLIKPEDEPKRWADLLLPKYRGLIGTSSLDVGGSAFTTWLFLREKVHPDFWSRIRENKIRIYPAVAPALTDVVRGEIGIAFMGVTSFQEQEAAGAPIKTIFPEEGSSLLSIQGGITNVAKNPNAAMLFLNWITSKRGGNAIVAQKAYAAHLDVPPPTLLDGRKFAPVDALFDIDPDRWVKVREPVSEEWRKLFGRR
jgi:iron(III) transport system substrate-binding protein